MTIDTKPPAPWISATRIIVLATPALTVLVLVFLYGVNVPFWDQWDGVPPLIEKMKNGTLGLSDFFAQHNEHRIFFPRLVMFSLALLTHWNIKVELFTSWVLVCICAYNLWRLQHVTGCNGSAAGFWLLFAANILLFTPLQSQNFLWGFQIGFFLPLAVFTSLLWIIPSSRTEIAFLAAIALSIIATFSIAGGFVSWLLALFLLLFCQWKIQLPRPQRMADTLFSYLCFEPDSVSLELPKAYLSSEPADRYALSTAGDRIYFRVLRLYFRMGN